MCRQEVGGASFGASGVEAMQIQERMFESWLYSERIKSVMAGVIASLFAILAFSLVMFGPLERGMSVNIFSTSFLVLAAGVAGFSQIRAKSFGHSLEAANAHAGAGEKTT
jgi:hypothetical protein